MSTQVGETVSLEVQGDFADAEDIVLPDSYLTYATENAGVVQVTESGDVTALAEGTTVLAEEFTPVQFYQNLQV